MKSVTIISGVALLLLLFLYFHYNRGDISEGLRKEILQKYKEHFTNSDNRMIQNGSFQYGESPKQFVEKKGDYEVIKMSNPGNSSYALQQVGSNGYYMLRIPVEAGKKYALSYWIGKSDTWNGRDKNFNIKLGQRVLSGDGKLVGSKRVDTANWNKYRYNFKVEKGDPSSAEVYLGYKPGANQGERYFTDLNMYPMIGDNQGFPVSLRNGLESYINTANPESSGGRRVMKDLSTRGNDMIWKNKPSREDDHVNSRGNELVGKVTPGKANAFTVSVVLKPIKGAKGEGVLVKIPGNQSVALMVELKNNMSGLDITIGSKKFSYNDKMMKDKSMISVVYKSGKMGLFQNGTQLMSKSGLDTLHFDKKGKIIYNAGGKLDVQLFAALVYDRALASDQLSSLYQYFMNYVPKRRTDKIYNYQMNNDVPGDVDDAEYGTGIDNSAVLGMEDNAFVQEFDTRAQSGIKDSWHERTRRGRPTLEDCVNDYNDELRRHRYQGDKSSPMLSDIPSCRKACQVKGNESSGTKGQSWMCERVEKEINSEKRCKESDCPEAYLSGDKYMVYVKPGSKYAKQLGRSGNFDYGTNRHRAREIYIQNFKGCEVPEILTPHGYKPNLESCPFIIDEMNPCKEYACRDAKWGEKNVAKQGLNKSCRRSVSNYCDRFKYKDPNCICWQPKYEDMPRCRAFRDYMDERGDKCRIDIFNIEEHPDMKNYIKKDKVPCWDCNLSDLKD